MHVWVCMYDEYKYSIIQRYIHRLVNIPNTGRKKQKRKSFDCEFEKKEKVCPTCMIGMTGSVPEIRKRNNVIRFRVFKCRS